MVHFSIGRKMPDLHEEERDGVTSKQCLETTKACMRCACELL